MTRSDYAYDYKNRHWLLAINNSVVELWLRSLKELKQALDSFGELKFSSSQPTLSYRVGTGTNLGYLLLVPEETTTMQRVAGC